MGAMYVGGEEPRRREAASGGGEEKILVSVRLRPLNEKEIAKDDASEWECIDDNTINYKNSNLSISERSMYPSAYTFDRVFPSVSSTRQVYEEGAKAVAVSVVNGINSSIFAYGQTSSGKTYTMAGITEYTLADIYKYIQKHSERDFVLKFSAMEIYNESVKDLLSSDSTPLRLLDDPERGTIIEKLKEANLRDWDHAMQLLSMCRAQRQIGDTSLNEKSSRSHQIIRLTIESSPRVLLNKDNSSTLAASVNFVDLAGSERASQSLAVGTRLKEGCHINRSLLTLGTVIRKLSKGEKGHVPYRESKLTRILQSSLGGNARTAIICTMSPARSQVEQSRNTLLFASCAKEVTTNARVNVVMSDKALVKQLRMELARLQNELKSPEPTFSTTDWAALLRDKDRIIEKLEKEIIDLTLQRDVAQAQVQDMLEVVEDDGQSMLWAGINQYPHLRVLKSPESEKDSLLEDPQSRTFGTSQYSDGESGSSSEDHFIHLPDLDENFLNIHMSPEFSNDSDSRQSWGEIEEQANGTAEDIYKEVRCIETEESNSTSEVESSHLSFRENTGISALKIIVDEDGAEQEFTSSPLKENKESSCVHPPSVALSPEKPSSWLRIEDSNNAKLLSLTKSRSCKENLMINASSPWLTKGENNYSTPVNGFEKELIGRPEELPRKFSSLHYGAEVQSLSRKVSQSSSQSAPGGDLEEQNSKTATDENIRSTDVGDAGLEESTGVHHTKEVAVNPELVVESKENTALKSVENFSLDPIKGYTGSLSDWASEFKRLQREIIELWDACNVSLVHRTYFFLMFKGDPADSIYMQVELRRLLFLMDTFSKGGATVEDGRTLTPTSSMKGLAREREMLSKEMEKKLSEEARECLFLKWGIPLNSKYRRLQLANRLWTKTDDMDHIEDSAVVVDKVAGFHKPGRAPKEMFGLNFAPSPGSRFFGTKSKVISLL